MKLTKVLIKSILVIIFIFNNHLAANADDITDFEIGGISLGESLLDHFAINEIENMYIVTYPGSTKYIKLGVQINKRFDDYDDLTFHVKSNDKKYKIHTINGVIYYENQLEKCLTKKKQVVEDLSSVITHVKPFKYDYEYPGEDKGSIAYVDDFEFKDGSSVRVWCVNWAEHVEKSKNYGDSLSISMSPKYFFDWLNNEAFGEN